MTIGDIIFSVRDRIMDNTPPYLWPDSELVNYANEAIEELCRECWFIKDDSSPMCTITLQPQITSYQLDERIWSVQPIVTLAYDGTQSRMQRVTESLMDNISLNMWETISGRPLVYLTDVADSRIIVYPKPEIVSYLTMRVYRYPMSSLSAQNLNAIPEIGIRYHRILQYGILARATSKENIDTFDKESQTKYITLWNREMDNIKKEMIDARTIAATNHIPQGFF